MTRSQSSNNMDNQNPIKYPDECANVSYTKQSFKEHLCDVHQITDKVELKQRRKACHIGCNGQGRFWCGFCKAIIKLRKSGTEAWDERFDHIDHKHYKLKENIEDWWEMNGKIKGNRDADGGKGGGKAKRSKGEDEMDLNGNSEDEEENENGSRSASESDDNVNDDDRESEHSGMDYHVQENGQDMVIYTNKSDSAPEMLHMEQDGFGKTRQMLHDGKNNDANEDIEMVDPCENEASEHPQYLSNHQQLSEKRSTVDHWQTPPIQTGFLTKSKVPSTQARPVKPTKSKIWFCVRFFFPFYLCFHVCFTIFTLL